MADPTRCPICNGWLQEKKDGTLPDICEYCRVFEIRLRYFLKKILGA